MVTAQPIGKVEEATAAPAAPEIAPLTLRLPPDWVLTNDRLLELCSLNETVPFEVDATGAVILNFPSGPMVEWMAAEIVMQFGPWLNREAGDRIFTSSALFELRDGNRRSPDFAWISGAQMTGIDHFDAGVWKVAPDFVVEILSASEDLENLQRKMAMWIGNGVRLGWLVDPFEQRLWVYRPDAEAAMLERPLEISDEAVLPGLVVDLRRIWRPT